ncbi:methyltransferase domain-containing protein [Bacillus sp. Xin]|uniref:class I SAM-dependent methyltransferase n=1 Tax=unclassified Bacillus (in: firmicutes) TaxID=185979 RepID=UPI0015748C7E|nr:MULTISPECIES: class I SAM-dependent methyltransferase [unclassified Bacillus (in: firmicutes)]MBC6972600.1 methyltransferase domain-containing protein [Bacillus sp. Xin]NSW39453.1 methyltransferase domain-containing protein [Bacillus sp. Xin1]
MNKQQEYWNGVANEKEFTTPFQLDLFSKYVNKDATLLDYGCGYGRTLLELKERQFTNLYGVDFSEEMIKRAKSNDMTIDFNIVKSGKLSFPDNFFDSVLLFAVLTCVYQNQEQDSILNEIKRVLKPEGIIYINDFLLNEDERNKTRYKQYVDKYDTYGVFELYDGAILRHHSEKRVKEWTNAFEKLEYEKVEYVTMNGNRSNGLVYIGRVKK